MGRPAPDGCSPRSGDHRSGQRGGPSLSPAPRAAVSAKRTASLGRLVRASALGLGLALLRILPPIVHFCTGPLGPLIGGFLSGSRYRLSATEGLLVGLGMGIGLALLGGACLLAGGTRLLPLPADRRSIIALGVAFLSAYYALLGGLGAVIGGRLARQEADRPPPPAVVTARTPREAAGS